MPGKFASIDPAELTLRRLKPRLEQRFAGQAAAHPAEWKAFIHRLALHFPRLFSLLHRLYGTQYDFYYHLEELLASLAASWLDQIGRAHV